MSLPEFISRHREEIIREFAAFAQTLMPPGVQMTDVELRDHAKELLTAVVEDMHLQQTSEEQYRKSRGRGSARTMEASGRLHAADRIMHGYPFEAVLAEFRALRASVLRLYEDSGASDLREVRRFNEAIDEGLTESMHQFASEANLLRQEIAAKAAKNTSLIAEIRDRRAAEEKIKELFRRLVSTQEEERRRISRDMHDQIGQQMTALKIRLEHLQALDGDAIRPDDVRVALQLVEDIDRSLTSLTWELRPSGALENFGLVIALENFVSGWSKRFGIAAEFHGPGDQTLRLPLDVATNLYALVQEALHNVVKHAAARNVAVLLQAQRDQVVLTVEDDGLGFDAAQLADRTGNHGLGLTSMRERASLCGGTLDIDAAVGQGTTILVRLPVTAAPAMQDV